MWAGAADISEDLNNSKKFYNNLQCECADMCDHRKEER